MRLAPQRLRNVGFRGRPILVLIAVLFLYYNYYCYCSYDVDVMMKMIIIVTIFVDIFSPHHHCHSCLLFFFIIVASSFTYLEIIALQHRHQSNGYWCSCCSETLIHVSSITALDVFFRMFDSMNFSTDFRVGDIATELRLPLRSNKQNAKSSLAVLSLR